MKKENTIKNLELKRFTQKGVVLKSHNYSNKVPVLNHNSQDVEAIGTVEIKHSKSGDSFILKPLKGKKRLFKQAIRGMVYTTIGFVPKRFSKDETHIPVGAKLIEVSVKNKKGN